MGREEVSAPKHPTCVESIVIGNPGTREWICGWACPTGDVIVPPQASGVEIVTEGQVLMCNGRPVGYAHSVELASLIASCVNAIGGVDGARTMGAAALPRPRASFWAFREAYLNALTDPSLDMEGAFRAAFAAGGIEVDG